MDKMKKYELTDEHRAALKPWADKWVANAMSTKGMDEEDRAAMRVAIAGTIPSGSIGKQRQSTAGRASFTKSFAS